ncbi:MAG: hypothetical protein RIK87_02335 [Fuerstiella sp.]
MPKQDVICLTPRYVLHEDRQPIGPDVVQDAHGRSFLAIYGFSGKTAYDRFLQNSEGDLRPYPLMKAYLQNRLQEDQNQTCIVILDAESPVADDVDAATIEHVLAAQNNPSPQLARDFGMSFCSTRNAYVPTESD